MSERLRDLVDAEDPAVAELARMVRAASDLDPLPGARDRVRAGLDGSRQRGQRSWRPVLVGLMVVGTTLVVIVGVRRLMAPGAAPPPASLRAVEGDGSKSAIAPPVPPMSAIPPRIPSDLRTGEAVTAGVRPQPVRDIAAGPELPPPAAGDADATTVPPPPSPIAPEPKPIRRPSRVGGFSVPRIAPARQASKAVAPEVSVTELAPPASPPVAREPASRPEAAALVLGALQKLRHDHDAAGALRLLEAYRARFPDGDLAEEALVLSIEARTALDDDGAGAAAAEYLRRFPHGRFRDAAEAAQRRFRDR
jgi:hypothetical protein